MRATDGTTWPYRSQHTTNEELHEDQGRPATRSLHYSLANQGQARISDNRNERAQTELRGELETFVCEGQYAEGIKKIVRSGAFGKTDHGALWIDHTIAALETRERGTIRTIDWSLRLGPVLARAREKRYQIGTLLFVPQRRHTHARAGNIRLGSAM